MLGDRFHSITDTWFASRFAGPTPPQADAWASIQSGRHTLVAAPTGSGKTLAAFLGALDELLRLGLAGELEDQTYVVYVSPLKALSNDIERNLQEPLQGLQGELERRGLPDVEIRTMVRTGDTPAKERRAAVKRPPHILVTTPESLYILLTSASGQEMLRCTRTVIVDEIHALVGDKRGSHLALTLERLEALVEGPLRRVGLSATQKPIEEVARFLVGSERVAADGTPACTIVDRGHHRALDLGLELPGSPIEAVMSADVWGEIYERLTALVRAHRTTLIFVNTRRLSERVAKELSERLGADWVSSHHGSLSRDKRLGVEQRLKSGDLRALVATASLELGIDIGDVDLVCQIGSPRSIATLLQRVGRSGHTIDGTPKGRLFPLSRDDLVESAALLDAVRRGELDRLSIPEAPLDILAQQMVATVGAGEGSEWSEEALFALVRRAYPYRALPREVFTKVARMLAEGFGTGRRRGAYLHRDAVGGKLRPRRGARLAAITSGGAIPEMADYDVVLEPQGARVGSVNEDFAIESMPGDIFQLGNTSWRILRVEAGKVRVEDARGKPPTLPFWLGEAPGRTAELSHAVSRLRARFDDDPAEAAGWLVREVGIGVAAAEQIAGYLGLAKAVLGAVPSQEALVIERFFDEAGGMQLVLHSPFGSRLNRAWGLALRKRFCRSFNFELQAAATEDAIVLSLGPTHSFPLQDVFHFLHPQSVRDVLVQALLDAPMFETRWRWNANRALAVLRWSGGKKVPPPLQRMRADDLIAVVFPDQLACLENIAGDREIPDHPLVTQTIDDCLHEAMEIERLEGLLTSIAAGERRLIAKDVVEPSPLAQEILSARPYAFLDDAPLEERRTQAVLSRRWLDPKQASDLGALDAAAIARVREEAWPTAESADELHDALVLLGFLREGAETEVAGWAGHFAELVRDRRAARLVLPGGEVLWGAAERARALEAIHPGARWEPALAPPPGEPDREWTGEGALREVVRGRLESVGPTTATALAEIGVVERGAVDIALHALEAEGFALRGQFTSAGLAPAGAGETEWCERRLLARIHRYTVDRLRREIEPVTRQDLMRFLLAWQRADPKHRGKGADGLVPAIEQLEGWSAPAAAWEGALLPDRLESYEPSWLDMLCLSGRVAWGRFRPPTATSNGKGAGNGKARRSGPIRTTPVALVPRDRIAVWSAAEAGAGEGSPAADDANGDGATGRGGASRLSTRAGAVFDFLAERGASFFDEIVRGTPLLAAQVEEALGELVWAGLVSADSFTGLRALLVPATRRPRANGRRGRGGVAPYGMAGAGRWGVLCPREGDDGASVSPTPVAATNGRARSRRGGRSAAPTVTWRPEDVEAVARVLLRRYGVVFRRLVERETGLPPWREVLRVYRRLEARGELRGGRFVAGFTGEQYALPEAVGMLRKQRREEPDGGLVSVSAADPLNLLGIIVPGDRLPALAQNRILYRDGIPVAIKEKGEVRFLVDDLTTAVRADADRLLRRRRGPARLRAYLGR